MLALAWKVRFQSHLLHSSPVPANVISLFTCIVHRSSQLISAIRVRGWRVLPCLALQVQVAKGIGRPLTHFHAQPRTKASAEPFQSTLHFSGLLRAFIAPVGNSFQPHLTLAVEVRLVSDSAAHCISFSFSSHCIASLCSPSRTQALRQYRHHRQHRRS